jgi:septum site-determining protein MinD
MADAKVFGIIALKGGVGKTTVVANLGAALAQEFHKRVLLVDANFTTPHLGLHVGMVRPSHTLHNVINNEYPIYEAIYQHPIGFHIIPGSLLPVDINPITLKEKLEPLREIYDVILIDSSPSLNDEMAATMAASDELIVVSSPDYPTLSSTLYAIKVAAKKNVPIRGVVINKMRNKKFELSPRDMAKAVEIDILATLSDEDKVLEALSEMIPVVAHTPKHEISINYKKLAGSLIDEEYQSPVKKAIHKLIKTKNKKGGKK